MNEPTITLKPTNPFYDLFPNGIVPVQSMVPVNSVYMLDGSRLSSAEMEDVARRVAELFGARVNDVRDELIEKGLPIRASEVSVHPAIPLRFIL